MWFFQKDEITYAELSLPNQQMPHVIYNQQAIPMSVIRRQEPTLYAQIDIGKRMPPCMQPLSPPHPSTFQGMQHLPTYMPRAIRDDTHIHDGGMSAETPLIHPRDTSVSQPYRLLPSGQDNSLAQTGIILYSHRVVPVSS